MACSYKGLVKFWITPIAHRATHLRSATVPRGSIRLVLRDLAGPGESGYKAVRPGPRMPVVCGAVVQVNTPWAPAFLSA